MWLLKKFIFNIFIYQFSYHMKPNDGSPPGSHAVLRQEHWSGLLFSLLQCSEKFSREIGNSYQLCDPRGCSPPWLLCPWFSNKFQMVPLFTQAFMSKSPYRLAVSPICELHSEGERSIWEIIILKKAFQVPLD